MSHRHCDEMLFYMRRGNVMAPQVKISYYSPPPTFAEYLIVRHDKLGWKGFYLHKASKHAKYENKNNPSLVFTAQHDTTPGGTVVTVFVESVPYQLEDWLEQLIETYKEVLQGWNCDGEMPIVISYSLR